jgi:hypothetical protein
MMVISSSFAAQTSIGNGGTMPRANEMLRADSRMMVVFGALTSKPEQLTFEDSLRFVKKVKVS